MTLPNISRRALVRAMGAVTATGATGTALAMPEEASGRLSELIADYRWIKTEQREASAEAARLKAAEPDGDEPGVELPFEVDMFGRGKRQHYDLGIAHYFARLSERLRAIYGDDAETRRAVHALDVLCQRSRQQLAAQLAEQTRRREASGLTAAWERLCTAEAAAETAFAAIVDFRPTTLAEVDLRNTFMAEAAAAEFDSPGGSANILSARIFEAIMLGQSARMYHLAGDGPQKTVEA